MNITSIVSLIISLTGAFLGALSFYLTQVRKPKINIAIEKRIRIGYADGGSGFQFYIPVTFVNKAQQTGVILKIQLRIRSTERNAPTYKIDLSRFSKLDEKEKKFIDNELPHAIAIHGKSSVYKLLRFSWWNSSTPSFIANKPQYLIILNFWTKKSEKPNIKSKHLLELSKEQIATLESAREKKSGISLEVTLDRESPNNEIVYDQKVASFKE